MSEHAAQASAALACAACSLSVQNVIGRVRQILFAVNQLLVPAFREPVAPPRLFRDRAGQPGRVRQLPRTPRLELAHHLVRVTVRGDNDVDVVRPRVDGVQLPAADAAVVADRLLDECALRFRQYDG
jgi:hypothetical protein